MDIIVTPDEAQPQRGVLRFKTRAYACVLGRSGVSAAKHEGDGATPLGRFPLRRVYYRADRVQAPRTILPLQITNAHDGWCDAPDDRAYNMPVTLPYHASAETMWRNDHLYDLVVVLGYNDAPVIAGAGSAIFLHVAPEDGEPTAGCVALARDTLMELLAIIDHDTAMVIEPRP